MRDLPLILLVLSLPISKFFPFFSFIDDAIILITIVLFLFLRVAKFVKFGVVKKFLIPLFIFILIALPWNNNHDTLMVVLSIFFVFKLHVLISYMRYLTPGEFRRLINFLFIFSFVGVLFQIVLPEVHSNLLTRELSRGSLGIVLSGLQANPNYLALTLVLFFVCNKYGGLVKFISILSIFSTGSRTGFFFTIAGWTVGKLGQFSFSRLFLYSVILSSISLVVLYYLGIVDTILNDVKYFSGGISENLYIRGIMIKMALSVSLDEFPFGVSLVQFGTPYSWGSSVYEYYGVAELHFFYDKSSAVFDSNLATILGGAGFLGLLFYFYSLYYLIKPELGKRKVFFYLGVVAFISIFMPVFSSGYLALVFSMFYKLLCMEDISAHPTSK